jgi:hypothetical protein
MENVKIFPNPSYVCDSSKFVGQRESCIGVCDPLRSAWNPVLWTVQESNSRWIMYGSFHILRFVSNRVSVMYGNHHPVLSVFVGPEFFGRHVYRCVLVTKSEEFPFRYMSPHARSMVTCLVFWTGTVTSYNLGLYLWLNLLLEEFVLRIHERAFGSSEGILTNLFTGIRRRDSNIR